jgi:sulfatase maturation enzyme AslB (radical SAM superfamily)
MNKITVSINPSYFCNFRCNFCYLTSKQLGDQKQIPLPILDKKLKEISKVRIIEWVDLYGGEIGALKKDYFYGLKDTIRKYYKDKINIITNYSMLHEGFFKDDFYLSVSYDFEAREKSDLVYNNMFQSTVPIAILILASEKVLNMDVDEMIHKLNLCSSIESVEIKPYSINQANNQPVTHKDFELFVKKWIESDVKKKFDFINEGKIIESLNKQYNAFSNNHVYITPNGNFGVLEFDKNDKEYFLELKSFNDYLKWADSEPSKNVSDICKSCKYYGHCLTEHYRYVKDLNNSCNGYKGLLDYYGKRMESQASVIS